MRAAHQRLKVIGPSPIPLTVLAGLDQQTVNDVATGLLLRVPRVALVWADPFAAELGFIQTRVTDGEGCWTDRTVELEHGCLSCAMREGVLAAIRGLVATGRYDAILLHLHPGVEADSAIAAIQVGLGGAAFVDSVVTVLSASWLEQLRGNETTAELGIAVAPDDERTAATILAANVECATALLSIGPIIGGLGVEEHAALSVLAPDTLRIYARSTLDVEPDSVIGTGRYNSHGRDRFAWRALLDPRLQLSQPAGGLRLVRWRAQRPVHPGRLHAALNQLADGVIRSTGYMWFATRPDLVITWDSAGDCLHIGSEGCWLTPPPGGVSQPTPASVSRAKREHARRLHHPYYGDRANHLVFLGDDLEAKSIQQVLSDCLLNDGEIAAGAHSRRELEDPFPKWSGGFGDAQEGYAPTA